MSEIRIADLFAGIGGIRMGMVQALGDAAHVVYSSEWNKYSVQTYEANWHDENPVAGDITKVDEHDVPDIDLLLAGFPCQPFSIAGVSKKQSMGRPTGFEDSDIEPAMRLACRFCHNGPARFPTCFAEASADGFHGNA